MQTESIEVAPSRTANATLASREFAADVYALIQTLPWAEPLATANFYRRLGKLIAQHTGALIVYRYDASQADSPLEVIGSRIDPIPANVATWCLSVANRCLVENAAQTETSDSSGGPTYQLSCALMHGAPGQCLMALHQSSESGTVEATLQLAAPALVHHEISKQIGTASEISTQLAALTELVTRMEVSENCNSAATALCENLVDYLQADHVAVALADTSSRLRVVAASNQDQITETQEQTRLAQALMQEAVSRDEVSTWPSGASDRHALLCHRQYVQYLQHVAAIGCPLRDHAGVLRGAVLVSYAKPVPDHATRFLKSAQRPVATTFQLIRRAEQNKLQRRVLGLFSKARRDKLKSTLLCLALLIAVTCIPIRYTVKARCKLEPTNKRYLAAPFAGKLLECLVEPGDVVDQNQLLANLDGQETQWELASVNAELQRAIKERAGHVAEHETGKARLARHEIEYLRSKAQLLTNRIAQLEVRSPIAGVIVSGDLTKAEGIPLEVGQSLFEIAPLDAMIAELSIPEDDVRFVIAELPAKIHLDAFPYDPQATTVERVRPRAEVRDNENVFVANANIENNNKQLRPGMEGTARIKTIFRPIGWVLFHKPWAAVVSWLGL